MRASDLLSPGVLSNGQSLRHEVAHAISRGEINIGRNNPDTLVALATFLTDAAAKVNATVTAAIPDETESTAAAVPDTVAVTVNSVVTFDIENELGGSVGRIPISIVLTGTATGVTTTALSGYTNGDGQFVVTCSATGAGTIILTATIDWLGASFTEAATVTVTA